MSDQQGWANYGASAGTGAGGAQVTYGSAVTVTPVQAPMGALTRGQRRALARAWTEHWQLDCFNAPCKNCSNFCYAFWCPCCSSYDQRMELLGNDATRYVCCGGLFGPNFCRGCTEGCPKCCLCLETWFCFSQSVFANRWIVQSRYHLQSSAADECIFFTALFCECAARIAAIVAAARGGNGEGVAMMIRCLADMMFFLMLSCMQTQQQYELDVRERGLHGGIPQVTVVTPAQVAYTTGVPQAAMGQPSPYYPGNDEKAPLKR